MGWELEKGGQNMQSCNYKIEKYWGCHVPPDDYQEHCYCMVYLKLAGNVDLKSSHHQGKNMQLYEGIDGS